MRKLKRFINKIKRHKRNKRLSKWADVMFQVSRGCDYKLGLNPLVYEIIRVRYPNEFIMNLFPDYLSKDKYSEVIAIGDW